MCRWRDGKFHPVKVIERRKMHSSGPNDYEYYVHYTECKNSSICSVFSYQLVSQGQGQGLSLRLSNFMLGSVDGYSTSRLSWILKIQRGKEGEFGTFWFERIKVFIVVKSTSVIFLLEQRGKVLKMVSLKAISKWVYIYVSCSKFQEENETQLDLVTTVT